MLKLVEGYVRLICFGSLKLSVWCVCTVCMCVHRFRVCICMCVRDLV